MRGRAWAAVALLVIAAVVVLAAGFSSSDPDGLERVAADLGFAGAAEPTADGPLTDYAVSGVSGGVSTVVAGLIGVAIVLGSVWLIGRVALRRRVGRPGPP